MPSDTLGHDNGGDSGAAYWVVDWYIGMSVNRFPVYQSTSLPTIQPATPRPIRPSRRRWAPTLPQLSEASLEGLLVLFPVFGDV